MFKSLRIISAVLALFIAASAARAQENAKYKELPNYQKVNANLFRGGQPVEGGLQRLASLGIKTIINLRDDDERARAEEVEARAAGLRYFNVPLKGLRTPSDDQVNRVLAIINAPENQPVFLHCRRGSDRTGIIIACYRISHDNWTSEQAKAEAKRYGMSVWLVWMKNYIGDYYERWSNIKAKVSRLRLEQRRPAVV